MEKTEQTNGVKHEKRRLKRLQQSDHWVASSTSRLVVFAFHGSDPVSTFIDCLMNKPMNNMR